MLLLLLLLLCLLRLRWLLLRSYLLRLPAAVAVAPPALPASDVLLPTAGAVHAAATSSTLDEDWLQWARAAAKRRAKPKQREQQKKQEVRKTNQMTALIGKKRQRGGSGVAETQMATEEGDEEANSSSRDRQGGESECTFTFRLRRHCGVAPCGRVVATSSLSPGWAYRLK
jgi:hypothetical protein